MRSSLVLSLILISLGQLALAKGGQLYRGGTGFLFQDANDFANPGQLALTDGVAIQADYARTNGSEVQSLTPSFVLGAGSLGFGLFASRTSANFGSGSDSVDTVGGAMALALAQDRLTLGVGYDRSISVGQTNDGTLGVALNYNGKGRTGFALGGKFSTLVNALIGRRTATAAIGYGFNGRSALEGFYRFNDVENNTSDADWGGSLTVGGPRFYFSGGYTQLKTLNVGEARGVFGLNFGALDIDVHVDKRLSTEYQYSYGGALRLAF